MVHRLCLLILALLCFPLIASAQAAQVTLAWDAPATPPPTGMTLTGYHLQGCQALTPTVPCTPVDIGPALPLTPTTWVDTSVAAGKTYCYTAVALYSGATPGRSGPSNTVCTTVPSPPIIPPAPQNLRAILP